MTTPRTIVYITSLFPVTRETFIAREIAELKQRGHEILVVSLRSDVKASAKTRQEPETLYTPFLISRDLLRGSLKEFARNPFRALASLGFIIRKLLPVPARAFKFIGILPKSLYLASYLRERKVAHIHAHWATLPTTCALFISNITKIPFSFSAHAWDIFVDGNEHLLAEKIARADRVFACTRAGAGRLATFEGSNEKVTLMYHGIEMSAYTFAETKDADPPIVLAGGSLTPQKGLDTLMAALARLDNADIRFRAIIFGEGPELGRLRRLANATAMASRIEFVGIIPHAEVIDLMCAASVFVMPSKKAKHNFIDGLPNVVGEAMACGAAVVATRFSGIPELVEDGVSGILVDPDDAAAIANTIEEFLSNETLRCRYARSARARVEQAFDLTKNTKPLVEYFDRVVSRRVQTG